MSQVPNFTGSSAVGATNQYQDYYFGGLNVEPPPWLKSNPVSSDNGLLIAGSALLVGLGFLLLLKRKKGG